MKFTVGCCKGPGLLFISLYYLVNFCLCRYLVLGQCRDNAEPKKLPITEEEQIYPWDTCAAVHDVRLSLLQRYFKDVSIFIIKQFQLVKNGARDRI